MFMKYSMKQHKNLNDYFHAFNSENIQYYDSIKKYLELVKNVKGDILQFGIGRGRSLIAICHIINEHKFKKNFYAFDSFEGFDFIDKKDKSLRKPKKGEWSKSPKNQFKYTPKSIKTILNNHIFISNFKKVKLVKGYVENTLPKIISKIRSISFINLDLDLYSGHKVVLENTFSKLSKNGIIYFDDIILSDKNPSFPGAKKAFKEFFANKRIKKYTCKLRKNLVIKKL